MSPKTPSMTTLSIPRIAKEASDPGPADFASRWQEARLVYPIYAALAAQFGLAPAPHGNDKVPPERPTREAFDALLKWLDTVDEKSLAYQIRQLPPHVVNGSEQRLRALIHRQLKKAGKTNADRDKIDLLLVQYFAMCASEAMLHKDIGLDDVARVLQPVLSEADPTPLEWCEPLERILEKSKQCRSLRDMMEEGLPEKGRLLKDEAGPMFYDPAALVAFCRFNFLLRRAFIRALHGDLGAVRDALDSLEAGGIKTVDCRRAGFSAAETTLQLRFFYENWRQPFRKDYTESSVRHSFEQLLALRADLEDALARQQGGPMPFSGASGKARSSAHEDDDVLAMMNSTPADLRDASPVTPSPTINERKAREEAIEAEAFAREQAKAPQVASARPAKPAADDSPAPNAAAEAEKCMEAIWEQLIAVPPSRGRSMSTVVLQDTKVLLSSWEVAAFVEKGSQESEDLRRAVVARALLAVASDKRKRSGDDRALASTLSLARTEVSYFQGRVEQAKKAKNTEAAVNLGISTKRLLSCIEEAETLQS